MCFDPLVLDNQLVAPPGEDCFSALSTPLLPAVLCLGLRPHDLSPIHTRVPIGVLLQDGILIVRKYKENVGRS